MAKKRRIMGTSLVVLFLCTVSAFSQTQSRPLHERPIISVLGRLAQEKRGEDEWLVLHAKNADTYHLTGNLQEKLKTTLLDLGEKNLFFITGRQDGSSSVSCSRSSQYETDKKGQKVLKTEGKCIRYYNLEVTDILSAKNSDEEIPPPKRDADEEKRLNLTQAPQPLTEPIIGEIYGTVSALNLKSAIKTVEIANRDKKSPLEKITLIIGPDTYIAKKIGKEEPILLKDGALGKGQEVTVQYARDELKTEALFITITKE